jgi:hypothetical protein
MQQGRAIFRCLPSCHHARWAPNAARIRSVPERRTNAGISAILLPAPDPEPSVHDHRPRENVTPEAEQLGVIGKRRPAVQLPKDPAFQGLPERVRECVALLALGFITEIEEAREVRLERARPGLSLKRVREIRLAPLPEPLELPVRDRVWFRHVGLASNSFR